MIRVIVPYLARTALVVTAGLILLAGCQDKPPPQLGPAGSGIGEVAFLAAEHHYDQYWGGPATDQELLAIGSAACTYRASGLGDEQALAEMLGGQEMLPAPGSEQMRVGLQRIRNAVRYLCGRG